MLEEPLTQEEIDHALVAQKQENNPDKTTIVPVPEEHRVCDISVPKLGGKPSKIYTYHDPEGRLVHAIARWDRPSGEKEIRPVAFCEFKGGKKRWAIAGAACPRPLYNLHHISSTPDRPVLVCEGEKAADAAAKLFPDYVATTPMHGAQSAHKSDWSPLKGRRVIIAADLDEAGKEFADTVYRLCDAAGACSVQNLNTRVLAEKYVLEGEFREKEPESGYDLADALEQGWTSNLISQLALVEPFITAREFEKVSTGMPKGFRLKGTIIEHEVIVKVPFTGEKVPEWHFLCTYLVVTSKTRDPKSQNWGYQISLIDSDGIRCKERDLI